MQQFTHRSLVVVWLLLSITMNVTAGDFDKQRADMVAEVEQMMSNTRYSTNRQSLHARVINAINTVPRHEFVPDSLQNHAYLNRPLPIGNDQTISQPYIVALMTELADLDDDSIVLEVGTGSGYQAAVLAEIVDQVYSIEIIEALGLQAETVLKQLAYDNVSVKIGDGYHGWPEHAPFDAILVTAAPPSVPQPLIDQLKPGGRMVIPVGEPGRTQSLKVVIKKENGKIVEESVLPVAFVPLTREH